MNDAIHKAIENLHDVLNSELSNTCVHVEVSINCHGYEMQTRTKTKDQLKLEGISMKNIKGEWVK